MPKKNMTIDDLWAMPRVGLPSASPDGTRFVVPATTWSMETNRNQTKLWLGSVENPSAPLRPLTGDGAVAQSPQWDPSGRWLLFSRKPSNPEDAGSGSSGSGSAKHGDREQIYLMDLEGGEPECLTDLPLGAADPRWFPDGKRIAYIAPVIAAAPTPEETAELQRQRTEDPLKVEVTEERVYRYWDRWLTRDIYHHIFVLDLETRACIDLTPSSCRWFDPMDPNGQYRISPDGNEIAFSACRTGPSDDPLLWGTYLLKVPTKIAPGRKISEPRCLSSGHKGDTLHPIYSPDGRWLAFGFKRLTTFYADRVRLMLMDRRTGAKTVLNENWDRSAAAYEFSSDSKDLLILAEEDARTNLYRLPVREALRKPATSEPSRVVRGGTYGPAVPCGDRILTTYSDLTQPPEVVLLDRRGKPRQLTEFTKAASASLRLGEVREKTVRGARGDRVQMFLVWPPGKTPPAKGKKPRQKLPLMHVIHGGPHGISGDTWHWRWNLQVFAAAGYLVASVNFHGSTSWGQEYAQCIQGQWGAYPYEDIMAATDALLEEGWVDPDRMAATGASYGGYLVSWIASQTDRFACIVNHAGVCDFQTQLGSDITYDDPVSMGGELWDDIEGMDRWNPLRHARGFRSPMLITHGELDYRVPYYQGLQIYNVYKMMGLEARLAVYPGENHWILTPRASKHWYGEVLDWLERWCKKPARRSKPRDA